MQVQEVESGWNWLAGYSISVKSAGKREPDVFFFGGSAAKVQQMKTFDRLTKQVQLLRQRRESVYRPLLAQFPQTQTPPPKNP